MFVRGLAALAVCALALPVLGSLKNSVERPFKETGLISFTPTSDLGGTFEVVGNATHLGKFVFPGVYSVVDFELNDLGYLVTLHIHGIYTAANGDSIEVDCPLWVTQYLPDGSPVWSTGTVDIVGGTGRFAHASGSYVGNIFPGDPLLFAANGTISY
jgi:hypothetical protein